ncbi:hypothetical protein [Paraburkholderia nemoris]|uniref:hypothetical protein n=1 Tax=Paraburkholderia nemoris TaxID=2793076 RepID=UPI001B209872|nr:hypothetical protein [Paraburkholderia nemoris]CAE6838447.1 hypothetical protein R75777_06949 [Paraburkholderia nemoris]
MTIIARAASASEDPALIALGNTLGASGQGMHALSAAADYSGPGALEVPVFEREIVDLIRRNSVALERTPHVPATGHPHRYFEQIAIATATSNDPRNLAATASGPTRVERAAFIKASVAQSNLSLFDRDVTEQQGQFASLQAKDVEDIITAIIVLRAHMFWNGTDTSLLVPTTLQWVGALEQITQQATIPFGSSIIDGLKTMVATMMANQTFKPKPTAIYLNPLLIDKIEKEAKASHIELKTKDVVAGVSVKFLATQAGDLPLIPDPYMPTDSTGQYGFANPGSGLNNYYAVITTESMLEIAYIGKGTDGKPRIFQLGLTGNLAGQFVGVQFDALIVKGYSYAHATVAVVST